MAKGVKTGGRQKGTPNKMTAELKGMILAALDESGGVEYLRGVAASHPQAFCSLLGKVLPMTLAGDPDNPIQAVARIELVALEGGK